MKYKKNAFLSAAVALAALSGCSYLPTQLTPQLPGQQPVAKALLEPRSGSQVSGKVSFTPVGDKLLVEAYVTGLTPGEHGFHVHEKPSCAPADNNGTMVPALAAGGHLQAGLLQWRLDLVDDRFGLLGGVVGDRLLEGHGDDRRGASGGRDRRVRGAEPDHADGGHCAAAGGVRADRQQPVALCLFAADLSHDLSLLPAAAPRTQRDHRVDDAGLCR